jgi:hypothetical protein
MVQGTWLGHAIWRLTHALEDRQRSTHVTVQRSAEWRPCFSAQHTYPPPPSSCSFRMAMTSGPRSAIVRLPTSVVMSTCVDPTNTYQGMQMGGTSNVRMGWGPKYNTMRIRVRLAKGRGDGC